MNVTSADRHLVIVLEQRFLRAGGSGQPVFTDGMYPRRFWDRYREHYDRVTIVARVHDVPERQGEWEAVEGGGVEVHALPPYVGPSEFVRAAWMIHRHIAHVISQFPHAAYILRVPGAIGTMVAYQLRRAGMSYGVEVVGDPYDVFAHGASAHPLRRLWRVLGVQALRRVCRAASAGLYVTTNALQKRYPAGGREFAASDVELGAEAFVESSLSRSEIASRGATLVTVGSLEQPYKGTTTLLRSLSHMQDRGIDVRARIVGKGRLRKQFEDDAATLCVAEIVDFVGGLPSGSRVREELDRAAIFVLPSLMEGLPRALVEAMARGLPAIGSNIGGIPELLPAECLVEPGDAQGLANAIQRLLKDPELAARYSFENLDRSRQYSEVRLQRVRREFWDYLATKMRSASEEGQ